MTPHLCISFQIQALINSLQYAVSCPCHETSKGLYLDIAAGSDLLTGNTGNMAAVASFSQHKWHAWIEQEANRTEIFVGVIHSELPVESAYHFLHSEREGRNYESQSRHLTMQNTRPGLVCSINIVDLRVQQLLQCFMNGCWSMLLFGYFWKRPSEIKRRITFRAFISHRFFISFIPSVSRSFSFNTVNHIISISFRWHSSTRDSVQRFPWKQYENDIHT